MPPGRSLLIGFRMNRDEHWVLSCFFISASRITSLVSRVSRELHIFIFFSARVLIVMNCGLHCMANHLQACCLPFQRVSLSRSS